MMKISTKGKHNFWSQLLVSMIAIFALPCAQGLNYSDAVTSENYQAQRTSIKQPAAKLSALIQQQVAVQQRQAQQCNVDCPKFAKIEPHFCLSPSYFHAPIRGSPLV